jgi:outer membrane lipoprotein-sorting protein
MKRRVLILWAAAAIFCLPAAAQTVDEVIAKTIAARGGLDKIKALQSVTFTGRIEIGQGMEAPFTLRVKRENQMRMEFTIQGMTATQAYDGKAGWQVMPFTGKTDAEPLAGDELKDAEEQADLIEGPLVDYKKKGNTVELLGKEDLEGSPAYKLKVTLKNGDVITDYIDADSYLEVKENSKRSIRGTETEIEETIGDYKAVGGLMWPYALEQGAKGSPQKQKIIIEKIELNTPLEDAMFKMPAAAPKPADANAADSKPKPADEKPAAKPPSR